jgi:hypothetical protein
MENPDSHQGMWERTLTMAPVDQSTTIVFRGFLAEYAPVQATNVAQEKEEKGGGE